MGGFANSKFIGAAFVGLNLVILAAATLCSYFAHDKDPMLEHLHRKSNKINKAMRAIEARHNKILTNQRQKINQIHQQTQELVYYYRKINQRERPDHLKPKSFELKHGMEMDTKTQESDRDLLNATVRLKKIAAS